MAQLRIVIADDHPVVRLGVRNILSGHPGFDVIGEAADGEQAVAQIAQSKPDLLLLDLSMPRMPGLEALRELADAAPKALQLGARGIVLKNAVVDELTASIEAVMSGQYWLGGRPVSNLVDVLRDLKERDPAPPTKTFGLTARELDVVHHVVQGGTNRDIASALGISEETVKRHLTNTFDKTGVSTRLELALFAMHHRLVTPGA